MNQRAFGRKTPSQTANAFSDPSVRRTAPPMREASSRPAETRFESSVPLDAKFDRPIGIEKSVDDELAEWKQSRRRVIPWRQLSLMASLSFGIASLVLPDSVAEPVEWLLYALTAASMISTVAAWWKKLTHVV
jgi:hypothetical protein